MTPIFELTTSRHDGINLLYLATTDSNWLLTIIHCLVVVGHFWGLNIGSCWQKWGVGHLCLILCHGGHVLCKLRPFKPNGFPVWQKLWIFSPKSLPFTMGTIGRIHRLGCIFLWGIPLFLIFPSFWTLFPVFLLLQENKEAWFRAFSLFSCSWGSMTTVRSE